jgi:hypothetical protein
LFIFFVQSLVAEYRALGLGAFWSKYSSDSTALPLTKILDKMKTTRVQGDLEIAELAKQQYGQDFAQFFSYRVAGCTTPRLLVRPDAIARRFRSLHPNTDRRTGDQSME